MPKPWRMHIPFCFIFMLLAAYTTAQQNCPANYEERTVKCNGQFVKRCIPVNYSCKQCWVVSFPPCPNRKSGGMDFFSTYEKALSHARSEQNKKWYCSDVPWWDNHHPTIYLDESQFCNGGNTNLTALNDLKNKIAPFLKRYKAEISNYRRYFSGKPYKPGAIVQEYQSMLKQAEDNVKKLEGFLNNLTDQELDKIETAFNEIQREENELKQAHANYESYINNGTTTAQAGTPHTNTNNNQQFENQLNAINQQFQTRRENNEQLFNTLQTGIQNIADILAQNAQRKADERQRQLQAEQQRKQQKLEAQLEEERKKREEEDRINAEMLQQFSIDSTILAQNNITLKTSKIGASIDSVYYIGYKRQYNGEETAPLSLKVFVVYRYSDGTFPLFSNVVEKSKFENNINRYGVTLLIGFFTSEPAVLDALAEIQSMARDLGISSLVDKNFKRINASSTHKTKDDNFWNQ